MKTYHIPIFVPHKGCPHDCIFCNQRKITGQTTDTTKEDVNRITEENLSTFTGDYRAEIAFFGGSFTGIELSKQTELLEEAHKYILQGRVDALRCSTRPDYITEEIVSNLKKYGMGCIELGVQSTDEEVLKASKRGHSFEDVKKAAEIIKKHDIELGVQMMLGLPGDTFEKSIKTANDLISLKPSCVRIYPTLVVPDTALDVLYQKGLYTPMSVEDTVELLSIIIPMFERENITIIRVGLQTTDEINADTVSGPYHPAIKELTEGRIIQKCIEKNISPSAEKITVYCHSSRVSQVIGHQKCNKKYFKEKYSLTMEVITDNSLSRRELKIGDKIIEIYCEV